MTTSITVNGKRHQVDSDTDTPLLYVLRNDLELSGAKYGCGLGQCGACTVHIDGKAVFSCLTPLGAIGERSVRTIEGLGSLDAPGVLQKAFQDEQAAQCGYCIAGMIMRAQTLLDKVPNPSDDEIRDHLQPNLCRCGTHARIIRAVRRASDVMTGVVG
jgi:aerobic-type carbon monoxide dehydrogenase small subunit (CoxS/CutS family)